ncbi:MAG: fructosamine kinase family protein [Rhodothermia bacterium]|nr:fructosamine kinase family protein [Rhodothermia bacterium]
MMLPTAIRASLEREVGRQLARVVAVSGGDALAAYKVSFNSGPALFVKRQAESVDALRAEKEGLDALLAADSGLHIPRVVTHDFDVDGGGYIAIEWLESSSAGTTHWSALGEGLARLHRSLSDRYGFGSSNFIGLLPQCNDWSDAWPDFFASRRLQPQVARAKDQGRWKPGWQTPYERLLSRLDDLLPEDPGASLVHGDLWGGNVMATATGPAVFDPAVYYGHREVDLAMSQLFGGFDSAFYGAYREAWPIEGGFGDRAGIYNLYHLLNHLNIFGGSYAESVDRVLRRFA